MVISVWAEWTSNKLTLSNGQEQKLGKILVETDSRDRRDVRLLALLCCGHFWQSYGHDGIQ